MAEMTGTQRKQLDSLNAQIATARTIWMTEYNAAKLVSTTVTMSQSGSLLNAWNNLSNLRAQRNALLANYRSQGIKI